jgi:transcriptional regulator with XRE-family HTH domain
MTSLQELRKKKNLSSTEVAERMHVSQGHYSHLERGTRSVTPRMITKLADALGENSEAIERAATNIARESNAVKSWVGYIRLNGLPLMRAFKYHIESSQQPIDANDDNQIKKSLVELVQSNIGYAVYTELSENEKLMSSIKAKLKPQQHHEQQ